MRHEQGARLAMTTREKYTSEWVPLLDDDGNVIARYNRIHRIVVIKRRNVEKRFHLALYDDPLDSDEQPCYTSEQSQIAAHT